MSCLWWSPAGTYIIVVDVRRGEVVHVDSIEVDERLDLLARTRVGDLFTCLRVQFLLIEAYGISLLCLTRLESLVVEP